MGHDKRADEARGDAPTRGVYVFALAFFAEESHVAAFGEILAEIMARAHLQSFAVLHQTLDAQRVQRAREAFAGRLASLDDGNGSDVLSEVRIHIQHARGFLPRLRLPWRGR